jgi:hypothetical protein
MKKLAYISPLLFSILCLSSCDTNSVEPQTANAVVSSAEAKKADNYTAHLQPENEVNPPKPIISNATGQIILKLSKDGTQLSYKLIVANIESVVAAHLHLGAVNANGGVVVPLYMGRALLSPQGVIAEGVITSASLIGPMKGMTLADLIAAIEAGRIYTNVHSVTYPAGEIRGQVK